MSEYRLYVFDHSGHIQLAHELRCSDDASAIVEAAGRSGGARMELWHLARIVKSFPANIISDGHSEI